MFFRTIALLCFCLVTTWVSAESPDHPLVSRYPGAEVKNWLYTEYEQIDVPSGPVDINGDLPAITLIGDLTKITYQVTSVSTLKVFQNYRNALDDAGATLVSVCELQDCGEDDVNAIDLATGVAGGGVVGNYHRKPYFIRAQLEGARGSVHIVLFVGGFDGDVRVQQVVVEEVPEEKELISVAQEYLNRKAEPAPSADQRTSEEKQQDHPMIARYPGAGLAAQRSTEYEAVSIPVGVVGSDGTPAEELDLTGDVYRYMYKADGVSTLKVYQNYLQAITELGFSLDYSCELTECGSESAASDLGKSVSVKGIENFYRKPYYFVATRDTAQGRMVIALYFGGFEGDVWVQQTIVEEKGTRKDLVKVDSDQLYQEIQQSGKALVYGIYFDTDSAAVKPESADALNAISKLLESHPELNLYVVGHTDDTGEGDYNLNLSSRRAASVVDVLRTEYSLENSRLEPAGVGPYAPVAGNDSDGGRRLNRRVELVRRL